MAHGAVPLSSPNHHSVGSRSRNNFSHSILSPRPCDEIARARGRHKQPACGGGVDNSSQVSRRQGRCATCAAESIAGAGERRLPILNGEGGLRYPPWLKRVRRVHVVSCVHPGPRKKEWVETLLGSPHLSRGPTRNRVAGKMDGTG